MNKHIKTILNVFLLCFLLILAEVPALAYEQPETMKETMSYRVDEIIWRYQIIDGKVHKRQYNTRTQKWIGNWIPA